MDQLIAQIAQRTGISDEQAREAVNMMIGYLKQELPAPIAAHVDSVLSGQNPQGMVGEAEQLLGGLRGMFGKR